MPKNRLTLSKTTEKRAFQEAASVCGFCREHEIASLQVHHIDGDPSNGTLENLLVVCASCHAKITRGVISEANVRTKKRQVEWQHIERTGSGPATAAVSVNISGSNFRGDIAQNLTKFVTPRSPRMAHPAGSLGADIPKKGYIGMALN